MLEVLRFSLLAATDRARVEEVSITLENKGKPVWIVRWIPIQAVKAVSTVAANY